MALFKVLCMMVSEEISLRFTIKIFQINRGCAVKKIDDFNEKKLCKQHFNIIY